MKLVRYAHDGEVRLGVLDADAGKVDPCAATAVDGGAPDDLVALVRTSVTGAAAPQTTGEVVDLADVRVLAPLPRPVRNIFCVGKNYREHAAEFAGSGFDATGAGESTPERPIIFTKPGSSVIGPGDDIDLHADLTSALDYEAEVAVIIGRAGRAIRPEDAWDHVWGYVLVNDVTARDLQKAHKQWFLGKSLDTFCPMGPWVTTADELDGTRITLECTVNGERRQHASTSDLIFDIPTLIATLSAGITLQPGDVIATGTPAGVGIGADPPRFLAAGDEVTVTATGLGTLTNRVRGAA